MWLVLVSSKKSQLSLVLAKQCVATIIAKEHTGALSSLQTVSERETPGSQTQTLSGITAHIFMWINYLSFMKIVLYSRS